MTRSTKNPSVVRAHTPTAPHTQWSLAGVLAGCLLWGAFQAVAQEPVFRLDLSDASLREGREPGVVSPVENQFGPGLPGALLRGTTAGPSTRLEWRLPAEFPSGEYALGLLSSPERRSHEYFHWSGWRGSGILHVYHNDRRVFWEGYTWPDRPEDASDDRYQAELRTGRSLLRLSPGDSLQVVYGSDRGSVSVGPLLLYAEAPPVDLPLPRRAVQELFSGDVAWLGTRWNSPRPEGEIGPDQALRQSVAFFNPLSSEVTFAVRVSAADYLGSRLLESAETITLAPGEEVLREVAFRTGELGPYRLTVEAQSERFSTPRRMVRYFGANRVAAPRPRYSLNGAWDFCTAPGVEPGDKPPEDAEWTSVDVPSWHSNARTHLAWYRKRFTAPAFLTGERILLRFGSVYSEAWVYVNGQLVHHQHLGSTPFRADITHAFREGEANEVLVAVRDWLAYSPANRERVLRGERLMPKHEMLAPSAYTGMSNLGIACSVWLEARPALAVEDVFVAARPADRSLTIRYRIRNDASEPRDATVRPVLLEHGKPVRTLAESTLRIAAGETAELTLEDRWPEARLWWPEDPHLYVLRTEIAGAGMTDRHVQRFGFRDSRMEGMSFYLNDRRMKLRTQWNAGAHGMGGRLRNAAPGGSVERRLEHIWSWQTHSREERLVQLSRSHLTRAGAEEACDLADETGMMLKMESDLGQEGFTRDERFWEACQEHILSMVDAFKNHPSVVQWSAGNENMWGWHYLGSQVQEEGTRRQVAIARAIQSFDLHRRPVDWSADGDLKGQWHYYSLHYPREVSRNPNLPNSAWWGPLDGVTTVPYSMGPVVLGSKPVVTGETFWPRMMRRPLGQSILYGDAAFTGPAFQRAGWVDSAAFFLNGFRDAEFAMIDTYVPLALLKPEKVVLKEETQSFYGGQSVRRHVNVHHDLPHPGGRTVSWTLVSGDGALRAQGSERLELAPAELQRVHIDVPLPRTGNPETALFTVELLGEEGTVLDREQRTWTVHPSPEASGRPDPSAISLYDPEGETASLFERMGIPFDRLGELRVPDSGALVIGKDAFGDASGPLDWAPSLAEFTQAGGRVAVMSQRRFPAFLPVPVAPVSGSEVTIAFVRAADHPVLQGLRDDDLRWWADDHVLSRDHFRKPLSGNVLSLVDLGTIEGMTESPLLEVYNGRGSYVLCQLLLEEKAFRSPPAAHLARNLVAYLGGEAPFRVLGTVALLPGSNGDLSALLERLGARTEDLSEDPGALEPSRHAGALVDASLLSNPRALVALRRYVVEGGRLWLHRIEPKHQAAVESLAGVGLRLFPVEEEPRDIQNRVLRAQESGWMSGISNHDLFWATPRYLQHIQQEGNWLDSYPGAGCPPEERIADYYVFPRAGEGRKAVAMTQPPVLLRIPVGAGEVLVNQLRLELPHPDVALTADRLAGILLTHLGVSMGDGTVLRSREERMREFSFFPVDLSTHANRGLRDDPEAGITGWTNQGENDARNLPAGRQAFAGVTFEIATPRSAVVLYSPHASNTDLPKEVTGIPVGRTADALFFLHTAAWSGSGTLFSYRVHYEDGSEALIPIVGRQHIFDWWSHPNSVAGTIERFGAFLAWQGSNPMRDTVMLTGYEWSNPHPGKRVDRIDILKEEGQRSVAVIAGITAAVRGASEGEVVEVLGTEGVRIRLEGGERDIGYIGVLGVAGDHPFHEQAVAAHRAYLVGKRVQLEYDAVREDDAGRPIAYVLLAPGDEDEARELVNGWIIGEGLGKLGNFGGNTRYAEYLENLQFISRQRRRGLWNVADEG